MRTKCLTICLLLVVSMSMGACAPGYQEPGYAVIAPAPYGYTVPHYRSHWESERSFYGPRPGGAFVPNTPRYVPQHRYYSR